MLLKNKKFAELDNENAEFFFNGNHKAVMSIYSQYYSMFPEKTEDELIVDTILYMLKGQDSEIPDQFIGNDFYQNEKFRNEFSKSDFICSLQDTIKTAVLNYDKYLNSQHRPYFENGKLKYKDID